ncbi:MAG: cryptochrome/photolyase family protein [Pseudomonadota bacterium]
MLVILHNQLFEPKYLPSPQAHSVFICEDRAFCSNDKHHQQKLVLFLAALREYADELTDAGYTVQYESLDADDRRPYEEKLMSALQECGDSVIVHFEIEDKPMEHRLVAFAEANRIERQELPSPMFTCTREQFREFAGDKARLLMGDFYKQQRRRLGLLLDSDGNPSGGRWSFDAENRKKLPKTTAPPPIPWEAPTQHTQTVIELVEREFADHPGCASDFCWPATRAASRHWLNDFIDARLDPFGPYEDAISTRSATVFHSLLSPMMNIGLLTPDEILDAVMTRVDTAPTQSLEGFVRQVIGWREFVRGVYREFGEQQSSSNFWSHQRLLTNAWYDGTTGIPPLDDAIKTTQKLGWTHHIVRLMVLGNLMTLCEIQPRHAHQWFLEMYVDASEWVMGPNVYGMALFSDGGVFATKPYICGSNYLLKMSDYGKGPWCDVVDGLYWRFIDKHRAFFEANHRLSLMPKALDRLDAARRDRIFAAAEEFLETKTR